jgi:site-specific DNA recombinase
MKGIIYVRVSSEEQVSGTSLAFQEDICRTYCIQHGIDVLRVFTEEGESAKTVDRTALLQALELCRKQRNEIGAFVVAKVDRLARNTEDHFYIRRVLSENGVQIHSVTEPIGNSPTEKFVETMLAASAEFDNAIRRQRCTDGMVSRMRQGIWPFRAPLGYACANHKKRGEKKNQPDLPDGQIFPIIQRALRAYAAGEVQSLAQLRDQMDAWGLAALRRERTSLQLVDRVLGQYLMFYAGVLIDPWTSASHEGLHVPMIDRVTAERIRLIRSGKARTLNLRRDRFNPLFPLRRTVRCHVCTRSLTGAVSRGNGGQYAYYFCSRADCRRRTKRIRSEVLHNAFKRFIRDITPNETALQVLEEEIREFWRERADKSASTVDRTEAAIADLSQRRSRVFEMREDGTYSKDLFNERLRAADLQLYALRQQLTAARPAEDVEDVISALRWLTSSVATLWSTFPLAARARLERFVLPEGVYVDAAAGVRTARLGLIFALSSKSTSADSPEVDLRFVSSNLSMEYFIELVELRRDLEATLKSSSVAA